MPVIIYIVYLEPFNR